MVVIAIIALLAAILFPVFARARENARRATCQSNLKQIGLAIHQYVQDYDETMTIVVSQTCIAQASLVMPPVGQQNGGYSPTPSKFSMNTTARGWRTWWLRC